MNKVKKLLMWCLCFLSLRCIHWRGHKGKGLGMYSDANRCTTCGMDSYGILVLFEDKGDNS